MLNIFKKKKLPKNSYYQLSIAGKREVNQDSCLVLELDEKSIFMAVADGMGGTTGGYISGNIAINIAYDEVEKTFSNKENITEEKLKEILRNIYSKIQEVIKEQTLKNSALNGMGTTLSCLLIHNGKYVWGNMGDSKIFKFKNKELIQLTEDHSYINNFKKENGNTVPTEMKNAYGHLLTKCLDGGDDTPDIFPLDKDYETLEKNNFFLLCSDGLIINNYKFKIFKPIFNSRNFEKVGRELVAKSLNEGSTDNITLILYYSS